MLSALSGYAAFNDYNDLVNATISACRMPEQFLNPGFTNSVIQFRIAHPGARDRRAADLSLAMAMSYRYDNDEDCMGDSEYENQCISLLTNIVNSTGLSANSWLRYAAAFEYAEFLNEMNKKDVGYSVSTNMLAQMRVAPPDMTVSNFWDDAMVMKGCRGVSIENAFKLNAALVLHDKGCFQELVALTNQLPLSVKRLFNEDVR